MIFLHVSFVPEYIGTCKESRLPKAIQASTTLKMCVHTSAAAAQHRRVYLQRPPVFEGLRAVCILSMPFQASLLKSPLKSAESRCALVRRGWVETHGTWYIRYAELHKHGRNKFTRADGSHRIVFGDSEDVFLHMLHAC
jgi:hypothetical protein